MDRRAFIAAAAATPLAALPAIAKPEANAKLLELIARLEAVQGWEAACLGWCKAWVADEIREAMGIAPIESEGQQNYVQHYDREHARYQEWLRLYGDWRGA